VVVAARGIPVERSAVSLACFGQLVILGGVDTTEAFLRLSLPSILSGPAGSVFLSIRLADFDSGCCTGLGEYYKAVIYAVIIAVATFVLTAVVSWRGVRLLPAISVTLLGLVLGALVLTVTAILVADIRSLPSTSKVVISLTAGWLAGTATIIGASLLALKDDERILRGSRS
jgi:hypothetical protein